MEMSSFGLAGFASILAPPGSDGESVAMPCSELFDCASSALILLLLLLQLWGERRVQFLKDH